MLIIYFFFIHFVAVVVVVSFKNVSHRNEMRRERECGVRENERDDNHMLIYERISLILNY